MKREHFGGIVSYVLLMIFAVILQFLTSSPQVSGVICAMVFLPLLSLCANLYVRKHIGITFSMPPISAKYSVFDGSLRFRNDSLLPAAKLYCTVKIINDLTLEEHRVTFTAAVGAGKTYEKNFCLESKYCGRLYVCVESLKIADYFGLILLDSAVNADARITILPELFTSDVTIDYLPSTDDEGTADRKGDDRSEVFQLREYQKGDDIRQIHWKLSSKLDKMILREGSQSISRSLILFWDKRDMCPADVTDALAESVASVAQGILDSGIQFDLCWTEGDESEYREITDTDSLLQSIPELVSRRGNEECPIPDFSGYGRVLYFSSDMPDANTEDKIFNFVCTDVKTDDRNIITFTSDGYKQTLERLEI